MSCLQHRSLKNAQVMKIILVGNSSVGKTSILQRYVYGTHEKTLPTVSLLCILLCTRFFTYVHIYIIYIICQYLKSKVETL